MSSNLSRRDFLKDTGVLVIGFSFSPRRTLGGVEAVAMAAAVPAAQLDSWLVVGGPSNLKNAEYSG